MLLLLAATLAHAQERPETGSECVPLTYSDYLVVLIDRLQGSGTAFAEAIGGGYTPTESARKTLMAVVANTRAQVSSLGDCRGDTALRGAVLDLVEFWDGMARNELASLTSYLADGTLDQAETAQVSALLEGMGQRGTAVEDALVAQQRRFASTYGFALDSDSAEAPAPAPAPVAAPQPVAPPAPYVAPKPAPKPLFSGSPKVFLRLHGGLTLDYAFAAGRRDDAFGVGADVNVGPGFRIGGLYKRDTLGSRSFERAHLILRYGVGSWDADDVVTFGWGLFIQPGLAWVPSGEPEFGADVGGELTLGAFLGKRLHLGLFYRVDYGLWLPEDGLAAESLGTWEVQPGMSLTLGI